MSSCFLSDYELVAIPPTKEFPWQTTNSNPFHLISLSGGELAGEKKNAQDCTVLVP